MKVTQGTFRSRAGPSPYQDCTATTPDGPSSSPSNKLRISSGE